MQTCGSFMSSSDCYNCESSGCDYDCTWQDDYSQPPDPFTGAYPGTCISYEALGCASSCDGHPSDPGYRACAAACEVGTGWCTDKVPGHEVIIDREHSDQVNHDILAAARDFLSTVARGLPDETSDAAAEADTSMDIVSWFADALDASKWAVSSRPAVKGSWLCSACARVHTVTCGAAIRLAGGRGRYRYRRTGAGVLRGFRLEAGTG